MTTKKSTKEKLDLESKEKSAPKKKEKSIAYVCIKTCVFSSEKISFTEGQIVKKPSEINIVKGSKYFKLQ